ncbi:hypothetical protein [Pelagibacterium sediminicola]|uniref:hypothetical protein n=1 Tax=Pelagibacterium sediminicola TaxID=2248761 RepID=UPI000E31FBA8|nr:hypothetical protein [Pelagibacterium sediminicola]
MPRADFVTAAISTIFPEWSSTRIARWLQVNPRTLQRWMKTGSGQLDESEVPADLQAKIRDQAARVADIDLAGQLDHFIARQRENGIDDEVLAAWLADRYKDLVGREID